MKIAFIGGGNMATALISGLAKANWDAGDLRVCDPHFEHLEKLEKEWGVKGSLKHREVLTDADCVILAVKPQKMNEALDQASPHVKPQCLIISVAAGVLIKTIQSHFNQAMPIIRSMPNLPAAIGLGITACVANREVLDFHQTGAEKIFKTVGEVLWVEDESSLDPVTAVSGSGPAYFFFLMQAMQTAAEGLGLTHELARALVLQTALGSATWAKKNGEEFSSLCQKVTSKGGTTHAALSVLKERSVEESFILAIKAASERATALTLINSGEKI